MSLSVNRIFGSGYVQGTTSAVNAQPHNFVKNTFNVGANPNAPEHRDTAGVAALGDPVKGAELYLLA